MSDLERFKQLIGKVVCKRSGRPFKSGLKTATVVDVISHPKRNGFAFIFREDDSYVSCDVCQEQK